MATYPKHSQVSGFGPGLVGTIGYKVRDTANVTLSARTTAGITESIDPDTGESLYDADVTLDKTWAGEILWDDGAGTFAKDPFGAQEVVTVSRVIEFLYETGDPPTPSDTSPAGVAVTSVIVNDVREAATNTLLNAGPFVMTHAGVGRWTLDAVAIGIDPSVAVYYAAAVVYADATSEQYPHLYDAGIGTFLTVEQRVRLKIGSTNASAWADLENNNDPADISAKLNDGMRQGTNRAYMFMLKDAVVLPLASSNKYVADLITDAVTDFAAGYVLKGREDQNTATANQPSAGDALIAEGDAILASLSEAGWPGVTLAEEDETPPAGTFEFVPAVRSDCDVTGDENSRPIWWS